MMVDIPFSIPESLASYVVQYEASPEKTIHRLKKQLKKRGPDPIGYFVLAWFYHLKGSKKKAIGCALKAKNYAPGSPFIAKLHYFFLHPQLFEAWQYAASANSKSTNSIQIQSARAPIADIDQLIQKLLAMDSPGIKNEGLPPDNAGSSLSQHSDDVDDIASETLAKIHEQQGKTEAAIKTYQKLKRSKKDRKDYYHEQIERLEKIRKNEEEN